jgi:hypothetical protein
MLDALRYVLWTIKKNQKKGKTSEQINFEKKQFNKNFKLKQVSRFTNL